MSVCSSSLGGLGAIPCRCVWIMGDGPGYLLSLLLAREDLKPLVVAHESRGEEPKTGRHLSFLAAKVKGDVGWLFKFLWFGRKKEKRVRGWGKSFRHETRV